MSIGEERADFAAIHYLQFLFGCVAEIGFRNLIRTELGLVWAHTLEFFAVNRIPTFGSL